MFQLSEVNQWLKNVNEAVSQVNEEIKNLKTKSYYIENEWKNKSRISYIFLNYDTHTSWLTDESRLWQRELNYDVKYYEDDHKV